MALNLPTPGEFNWADKLNDALEALEDRLPSITPESFGAEDAYSASVDDTAAVQAALVEAITTGHELLLLRKYRLTAPVTATNLVNGFTQGPRIRGVGHTVAELHCDFDNGAALDLLGADTTPNFGRFWYGGYVNRVRFTQAVGRAGVDGLSIAGWWASEIHRNQFSGLSGDAIVYPERMDIDPLADYWASCENHIHHNDIDSCDGMGINADAAGLAFSSNTIEHNRIANTNGHCIAHSGHSNTVRANSLVNAGRRSGAQSCGLRQGYYDTEVNSSVVEQNEFQGNVRAHVEVVSGNGFDISRNRLLSDPVGTGGSQVLYPPVHVLLGDAGDVHGVTAGRMEGNYHRNANQFGGVVVEAPVSLYKATHTSVQALTIVNAVVPVADNSSATTKYDGFTVNNSTEIIEMGRKVQSTLGNRAYVGRIVAPQTIPADAVYQQVVFENEAVDFAGDGTPALGYLTPYFGLYDVSFDMTLSSPGANNIVWLQVRVDGNAEKEYVFHSVGNASETFSLRAALYLSAGQRVTAWARSTKATPTSIREGTPYNGFQILPVG